MGASDRVLPASADWHRRSGVAARVFAPWIDDVVGLEGRTVLEYGCGAGPIAAAFAGRTGRYIGVDIDAQAIAEGRSALSAAGVSAELRSAPAGRVLDLARTYSGEIDILLCYAVLEHLNVEERLALLEAADDIIHPDGALVVIETPNRLTPWDYHTSQVPFLDQLPEPLALAYAQRSPREELRAALEDAATDGPEAMGETLTRWGRGVSYHEFELVFGDLTDRVAATGWDPMLLKERFVHREELALQRVLSRARPDISPAFSRCWIDLVLRAKRPEPLPQMRPWSLQTTGAPGVAYLLDEVLAVSEGAVVAITLPHQTRRVVVGAEADGAEIRATRSGARASARGRGRDGHVWCDGRFEAPEDSFEVRLAGEGHLTCVLYEA